MEEPLNNQQLPGTTVVTAENYDLDIENMPIIFDDLDNMEEPLNNQQLQDTTLTNRKPPIDSEIGSINECSATEIYSSNRNVSSHQDIKQIATTSETFSQMMLGKLYVT